MSGEPKRHPHPPRAPGKGEAAPQGAPERRVVLVPVEGSGRRRLVIALAVLVSLAVHGGLAGWVAAGKHEKPRDPTIRVRVAEVPRPPPEPTPPEPEPPPPPVTTPTRPVDLSRPEPPPLATNTAPPDAPVQPSRPVFGVSMQSTVAAGAGAFQVSVGNTVAKEPDKTFVPPDQVGALPAVDYRRVETEPEVVRRFQAPYPQVDRDASIEGTTVLRLTIDEEGRVTDARVVKGPSPTLNQAAREAMLRHVFKPATVDGRPRAVTGFIYEYVWIIDR